MVVSIISVATDCHISYSNVVTESSPERFSGCDFTVDSMVGILGPAEGLSFFRSRALFYHIRCSIPRQTDVYVHAVLIDIVAGML